MGSADYQVISGVNLGGIVMPIYIKSDMPGSLNISAIMFARLVHDSKTSSHPWKSGVWETL